MKKIEIEWKELADHNIDSLLTVAQRIVEEGGNVENMARLELHVWVKNEKIEHAVAYFSFLNGVAPREADLTDVDFPAWVTDKANEEFDYEKRKEEIITQYLIDNAIDK